MPDRRIHQTIAERFDVNAPSWSAGYRNAKIAAFLLGVVVTAVAIAPMFFMKPGDGKESAKPKNAFRTWIQEFRQGS